MAQQQKKDIEKYRGDLKREASAAESQRLELMRTQRDLRESRAEVRNLTGSMALEVRRREEAAARVAELLCCHPSVCIEAWIGKAPWDVSLLSF